MLYLRNIDTAPLHIESFILLFQLRFSISKIKQCDIKDKKLEYPKMPVVPLLP